tara:strand:+ start:665 stop:1300 length:636 start_codon:yes stop_codon:yes gene_type:complete
MIVKPKHIQAFTLVETVTALIVSGAIFVGVFSIFSILNNKFEAELVRGELVTYCNYALDDMVKSIRLADQVYKNNDMIVTRVNRKILHTYAFSQEEGILKDGIPIHEEIQNNPNNTDEGTTKHKLFYISKKKNGFIKYILEKWYIDTLSDFDNNVLKNNSLYDPANGKLKLSSFVIKLHAKLIMGWDEEVYIKRLDFERFVFSPGIYLENF